MQNTEVLKEKLLTFFMDSKKRNKIILALLLFILFIVLIDRATLLSQEKKKTSPGTLRAMMCVRCLNKEVRRVKELKKCRCSKCGGQLGFAYKCDVCDKEFPVILKPIKGKTKHSEIQFMLTVQKQCPNCNSQKTHPLSVSEVK
jgi:DNA-directed RNA polymerase subunit RPC12/RpoP